jgi:YVTN family beta-propeller protein
MKCQRVSYGLCLILILSSSSVVAAQARSPRDLGPDQPGDEENLNRELWEYARKTPYERALRYVARTQQAARAAAGPDAALPNGWKIAPAGAQVEVGRFPCEAVPYAGRIVVLNTGYYVAQGQEVSIVDPDKGQVVKVLRLASMFPSAQEGLDGNLYISGGISQKIYRINREFELAGELTVNGYTAGIATVDGNHIAVACLVSNADQGRYQKGYYEKGKLIILNTATGKVEHEVITGYFPNTVRFVNGKLYCTLLGENKLLVYSTGLNLVKKIEVGQTPQDICSEPDGKLLYVVNTGSDTLSVIDTTTDTGVSTIDIRERGSPYGAAPTSCAVRGNQIYIAEATTNSVAVYDKTEKKTIGFVPAGWYPTKVIVQQDRLLVLSAKGIHERRPNKNGPQPVAAKGGPDYVLTLLRGSLGIIPIGEIEAKLPAWTKQVEEGSPLYSPLRGFKLPIRHIFYVIRENRSYDQILGDLQKGNNDSSLTLFGKDVTPNGHHLAEEFVTLDNYYADGEISVLGHSFTTSGYASPFLEWLGNAAYSGRYTGYPFGMVPAATSPAYLWDALDEKGVDYRIYGENYFLYTRAYKIIKEAFGPDSGLAKKFYAQMMRLAQGVDRGTAFFDFAHRYYGQAGTPKDARRLLENIDFKLGLSRFLCGDDALAEAMDNNSSLRQRMAEYLYRYPSNYRSWDLNYSDLDRARAWKTDFDNQVKLGNVAALHYIWLPNDHTGGTDKKYLKPDELIAQNDAALGLIIETIARSPIWKESLVLVTEDDAQNGPDHVDATRTVALAVGPYVKRHQVISDRYDQLSMLRTIEILLGLGPLNLNDLLAVPMFNVFTDKTPDMTLPPVQPSNHLADSDRRLYQGLSSTKPQ